MNRLRRDLKPYIAALRLSKTQMILFVEGTEFDPMFYGKILERYQSESAVSTELRRATDIPSNAEPGNGGSGGKYQLSQAAQLWERYKAKHLAKWRKQKALVFCIDKDAEDMTGLPEFVPSLVRTPYHSVENHLFCSARLADAVEAALSAAPGELDRLELSNDYWNQHASSLWKEWVTFCLICLRLQVDNFKTYSTPSLFNRPLHGDVDKSVSEPHFLRLQVQSGLDSEAFSRMRKQTEAVVSEMFSAGQHDRIFKGKWYCDILFSELSASQWSSQVANIGKRGLLVAMRANFKLRDADYQYYWENLNRLRVSSGGPASS